ncbi:MAG: hypothetical protein EOO10_05275 [Chitinophagaceae bacterium]|nr:MAG: hypothetical protein EOO10_05275 [Chitinophagaceae bacterium]
MTAKNHLLLPFLLVITSSLQAQCISGNCENGNGTAVIDSTIMYTGSFNNGLPHGQGIFSNAFGRIYEGGVWKGLYHGMGKLSYSNGDSYIGDFVQGLRHGKGIFTSASGVVMNGRYLNDRYIDTTAYADTYMGHQQFTNYSFHNAVFSSDNKKVAILGGNSLSVDGGLKIFDVETGKLLERVNLKGNGCKSFTGLAKLYLDFGRAYETHLYDGQWANTIQLLCPMMEKIYPKNSVKDFYFWNYEGKSSTGQALFWILEDHLSSSNKAAESSLIAYEDVKAKPTTIIKPARYINFITVSPDLKRVFLGDMSYCYIKEINPKKNLEDYPSIRTAIENTGFISARFIGNGDTLFVPERGLFSSVTGKKIQDFRFATNRLDNYSSAFSSDMQWAIGRTVLSRVDGGNLVCVLNSNDPNYLLPLIDPGETEATIRKTDNYYAEMYVWQKEMEAKRIADYERQMEREHGKNWKEEYRDNPLQKKVIPSSNSGGTSNHTCTVCSGSGKVVDELQDNLVQDKNSGRWYKKAGTVYKNCLRCGGKGYVTY